MSWKFNDAVLLSREANDVANIPELLRTRRVVELEEADNIQVEQHFDLGMLFIQIVIWFYFLLFFDPFISLSCSQQHKSNNTIKPAITSSTFSKTKLNP